MSKIWHDNRKHCCKRRQKVKRGLHHSKMVPMPKSVDDISRPRNLEESQVKFVEATLSGGRDEHTKHQPLPKTRDSIEIVQEADTMPVDKIQRGPDTMRHNILGDRLRYMGGKNTNTPQWVRYMTPSIRHNLETPGLKKVPQKVMFTIPLSARSHATPVIEDPLKGIRDIIKNRHYFLTTEEAEEEMYPILSNSVCNQQSNERKTVSTQSYKIPNVTPTRGESTTEGPQEAVYPIPFDPSCDEYPTKDQVTEPTTQWENCSVKPTTKKICTKGRQSTVYPTPSDTDNGGCPIRSKVSKQEPTNSDKDNMTPARKNVCGEWQRTQFQKSTPPFTVEYRTEGKVCTRQPQVEEQTTESYTTENASTTPVTFKFNPVAAGPIWTWPMDVLLSVLSKMQKNENNPTTLISTQDAEQVLRGLTTPQEEEPVTQHENRQEESKQEDYSKTNHQNTEENNTEKRVNDIDHQNEEIHQILEEMLAMMAASNNGLETTSQTPGTGWAPILNETTPSTRIKPCSD
ncbi:hypothetical protein AAG570_005366 [Ranatra chinensis]|uniref:Uncharacterized protein n=1 Tax=Ranatra chinensis TaxID=642074 RepID=A0ABD0Y088_9HEMI